MRQNRRLKDMLAGGIIAAAVLSLALPALAATGTRTVTVEYRDIQLVLDGQTVVPTDGRGNVVEPFTLDGVTYLPVRAVGDALGLEVEWNGRTNTVTLTTPKNAPPTSSTATPDGHIGLERAKAIALNHAGVRAADATFYTARLDRDHNRAEYEIEFYSGLTEYDYDIDADTGEILSFDYEVENHAIPSDSQNDIGLERARRLAQDKAPNAELLSCKFDWEDGKPVYEGELREGRTEYEFTIDAVTGDFLHWEADHDD